MIGLLGKNHIMLSARHPVAFVPQNDAMNKPLLYTFRRCPYAIRARLAIAVAGVEVAQYEVSLRDKPHDMLAISPKGTVPVLQLADGVVLEESLDIMRWALSQNDPAHWLDAPYADASELVTENDVIFKPALDRYKYPTRYPQQSADRYRDAAQAFPAALEARLAQHRYLTGNQLSWADAAIFPFIRQFAAVEPERFANAPNPRLRGWLAEWLASPLFTAVMQKPTIV
jgi:glutathione S-transferase